ncbi:hypothetical protein [Streptomyces sp. NPDC008139]|uniref:hypothetical protein n=1 Tax=Streptomyces sp. NPDC008139 TaxID=3364814 RepID=UPI0036EFA777
MHELAHQRLAAGQFGVGLHPHAADRRSGTVAWTLNQVVAQGRPHASPTANDA